MIRYSVLALLFIVGVILGSSVPSPPIKPKPLPALPSGPTPVFDVRAYFPIGVFEDAHIVNGRKQQFEVMLRDLQRRGLDSVLFSNNQIDRDAPLLDVSDRLGMSIYFLPNGDLNRAGWWRNETSADLETALTFARPIVTALKDHPSLKGYNIKDEPFLADRDKVVLMTRAFRELDPSRPVMTTLIGLNRVEPIFNAAQFDVMQIDVYPFGRDNGPCDLTMNGFAYPQHDFVSYIRTVSRSRPPGTPLWIILQTHSFDADRHSLRTPKATEVRMQQWLAVGEGATGIFWFVYSTQQSWTGLVDNPELYEEITRLTARLRPLRLLLLDLERAADRFQISGNGQPYISTLVSSSGKRLFTVAVNRDCRNKQVLYITSSATGRLRDMETGQIYDLGTPITFAPGDGHIFELVSSAQ